MKAFSLVGGNVLKSPSWSDVRSLSWLNGATGFDDQTCLGRDRSGEAREWNVEASRRRRRGSDDRQRQPVRAVA